MTKNNIIILLIIILLIGLLYHYYIIKTICNDSFDYFIYKGMNSNKTIMIIGGTHGNEPAGTVAIKQLIDDLNSKKVITKHNLILIPYVNYCGVKLNIRHLNFLGDINRQYPINIGDDLTKIHPINKKIMDLMNKADIVLDFHEGWGFFREHKKSIGNSITPTDTQEAINIANLFYNVITDPVKKFVILTNDSKLINDDSYKYSEESPIKGSFRNYCQQINKNYILIETAGQNDVQDIAIRVKHNRIFIDSLIN